MYANKSVTGGMKGLSPIASVASSLIEHKEQLLVHSSHIFNDMKSNIFHDDSLIYFLVIRSEFCSNVGLIFYVIE